jgi:UDP-glucose 4-epimerase
MTEGGGTLITGGAGFIGSYVGRRLLERGDRVRIFDNLYHSDARRLAELVDLGAEFVEGDVSYHSAVTRAVAGAERVIHLAALCINKSVVDPEESLAVNLLGAQHVFDAAAQHGVRRVVFASSASVYGEPDELPQRETDPLKPQTPYCLSKLAGEHLLRFYGQRHGMAWMALRFFNVYGAGQQTDAYYTSVILTFLRRIAAGEAPTIDGRGEQSADFVHVEDVARAVVAAHDSDVDGEVVNIGTGTSTTIAELAAILLHEMGSEAQPTFRPRDVLVSRRAADITKADRLLGWKPEIDVATGLARLAADFRAGRVS